MRWRRTALLGLLALAGCASVTTAPTPPLEIALLAFNDLHGHLEPPRQSISLPGAQGPLVLPAGGMAYLASTLQALKARTPHHAVVSAGDLVGASPMLSALFLDEPTIEALNQMQVDASAVGNHELDRGWQELLRLQRGGCARYTVRQPCQLSPHFAGANFPFLAANILPQDGQPPLPATTLKRFTHHGHSVTLGFIGVTLQSAPKVVAPAGVRGLYFADEADTANAHAARLRAEGADIVVLALHQGGRTSAPITDTSCAGLSGDIVPVLQRLSPAIDVVLSGHTHQAYVCDYASVNPEQPFLLTSAGAYGLLVTDITLRWDVGARRLLSKSARNVVVQNSGYQGSAAWVSPSPHYPSYVPDVGVQAVLERYRAAAAPLIEKPVGGLLAAVTRQTAASGESALGNLVADAQLWATQAAEAGGAQISFMHAGGLRADLLPDAQGQLRYGQLFAVQPFGNHLVVKTLSGAQIRALLEQQFALPLAASQRSRVLSVSQGFGYAYDLSQPPGKRVGAITLHGQALDDAADYRVVVSSFLAQGGDRYTVLTQGREVLGGSLDIDALEGYFQAQGQVQPPAPERIRRLDAAPK